MLEDAGGPRKITKLVLDAGGPRKITKLGRPTSISTISLDPTFGLEPILDLHLD